MSPEQKLRFKEALNGARENAHSAVGKDYLVYADGVVEQMKDMLAEIGNTPAEDMQLKGGIAALRKYMAKIRTPLEKEREKQIIDGAYNP